MKQFQPNGDADRPAEGLEAKYQYQRAYKISKELRDQLYTYSSEQINQIKTQNVVLQRASATAHTLTELATNSYGTAQTRVHKLSDKMLSELRKVEVRRDLTRQCIPLLTSCHPVTYRPRPLLSPVRCSPHSRT